MSKERTKKMKVVGVKRMLAFSIPVLAFVGCSFLAGGNGCENVTSDRLVDAAGVYLVPASERLYDGYVVAVDGTTVPVSEVRCSAIPFNRRWPGHQRQIEQTELCGMVRFAFGGKATVSVTANRDFKEVKVRPLSRNVVVCRDGG